MAVLAALLGVAAALLALLLVLAVVSSLHYNEWRRKGIPYVTPWPLVGNCFRTITQRENLYQTLHRVCERFPKAPFVGLYAGATPVLLVKDLEAIKNITVKDFHIFTNHKLAPDVGVDGTFGKFVFCLRDDEWKSTRVKLSPAFTSGKLKSMHLTVRSITSQFVQVIRDMSSKGCDVPLGTLATQFGIDVIGSCALGIEPGAMRDPQNSPYMKAVAEAFRFGSLEGLSTFLLLFSPIAYKLARLPLLHEWRTVLMRSLLRESAQLRDREPAKARDIFDILLGVRRSGEMPEDVFEAQVMAMQVAGSETSAKTIMFALWEMARAPRVQDKLRQEVLQAVGQDRERQLTYEDVHDMPYLDTVFKETLRLWPVLPWLDRVCSQDYKIPGTDVTVEKDSFVLIPAYSIQRDPNVFHDPDTFLPERFAPENSAAMDKAAFLSFGFGPRACIGSRFADMTVKTALADVVRNFRVSLCDSSPRTHDDLVISSTSFLITLSEELLLRFEPI
ncbi:hypothetical protein ONE63_011432 [Megalurothrips usitatus]|uniref:Uncharacterized protein n=1 Tax=Megalurothrips usitatus TaxID=439358 RepID=A0AAV7X3I6_9NEOP|nr:hypothetical protein ONE63_011432 [Megalurothrips usitatus]